MLANEGAAFANLDQDATAVERRYDLEDPRHVSRDSRSAGQWLATRFDGVTGRDWSRTGLRSDGKSFTVATFAVYVVHDPLHHLWDVGASESVP